MIQTDLNTQFRDLQRLKMNSFQKYRKLAQQLDTISGRCSSSTLHLAAFSLDS